MFAGLCVVGHFPSDFPPATVAGGFDEFTPRCRSDKTIPV
jgi:hypothetical protein